MMRMCLLAAICLSLAATSCENSTGLREEPQYSSIPGTATIMAVSDAPAGANNCRDAVAVFFTFVPDDLAARTHYRIPAWPDSGQHLTVGDGKNPARTWADAQGLVTGSRHRCFRHEENWGTATPVMFEMLDVNYQGYAANCFSAAP